MEGNLVGKRRESEGWSKVTAVFEDSDVSFLLPRDATMAELAERLAIMAVPHGAPVAVDIRLAG
jgi:hypothetical protein